MAKITREIFSDTASEVAKLAFPNVKDVTCSQTTVYNARFDGGAIATMAAMIHATETRAQAESIVQYLADHVEARFCEEDADMDEMNRLEIELDAVGKVAASSYARRPDRDTARTLYIASLAEGAVEARRRAVLVRKHLTRAA
jgi:hypothetical protein